MNAEAEQQPYGWEKSWVDTQQGDGAWTQGECHLYMRWAGSDAYWKARWPYGEHKRRFECGRFEDVALAEFRAARELLVRAGRLPELGPEEGDVPRGPADVQNGHQGAE